MSERTTTRWMKRRASSRCSKGNHQSFRTVAFSKIRKYSTLTMLASLISENGFHELHNPSGVLLTTTSQIPDPSTNLVAGVLPIVKRMNQIVAESQGKGRQLYFKGTVASGKTTTLRIIEKVATNCLYFDCYSFKDDVDGLAFDSALLATILKKWPNPAETRETPRQFLEYVLTLHIPERSVLFIDGAQIAFSLQPFLLSVAKNSPTLRCFLIFVGTRSPGATTIDFNIATFMINWSMDEMILSHAVQAVWGKYHNTTTQLESDAKQLANFLLAVTGGHRGFCAELLGALSQGTPDLSSAIGKMNTSFCNFGGLTCRAAGPNGYFDQLINDREEDVIEIIKPLLGCGAVSYRSGNETMRFLITIGTLSCEEGHLKNGSLLRVPNPFYARNLRDRFNQKHSYHCVIEPPNTIFDWLVYGTCYFDLECLFNSPPGTTQFELQIDAGITGGIRHATGSMCQSGFSSTKGSVEGKPDVVVDGNAIEFVLEGNDTDSHFDRFDLFPAYRGSEQLLVVFSKRGSMKPPSHRAKCVPDQSPAKIAIVSFAAETFWTMTVLFLEATETVKATPVPMMTLSTVPMQVRDKDGKPVFYTHDLTWKTYTGPQIAVDFVAPPRHLGPEQLHVYASSSATRS